jgi:dTDP-4-dehydrorhamnose reductase
LRVGVTGADGLLGATLVPLWRRAGADVVGWTLADFDVTDGAATRRAVVGAKPDVVVHAAAYTAVDRAEAEPAVALAVNRDGTANVAAACTEAGARLVYVSTDYVFDGSSRAPVSPEAPRRPLGAYGRSKADGEAAVEAAAVPWAVVRTEWLFGPGGGNFVATVLGAAREDRALRVVNDQVGAPTSTRVVSEALWGLVARGARGRWHVASAGAASWFDVARSIYAAAGRDPALVAPCTTAESGRPARRPASSILDCSATVRLLGVPLPPWEGQVVAHVRGAPAPGLGLIPGEA